MAKAIPDAIIDLMLDQAEGLAVHVNSAQPTTYTEAATTYKLATEVVTGGNFAKANGDTSGRKNTCTPGTGTTIDSTGTATHVSWTTGTTLLLVTTCTSQALTAAGTVDIGAHAHEIGDPS
jgi:hypothetical protein